MGPDGAENLQELLTYNLETLEILKVDLDELGTDGVSKVLAPFNDGNSALTQLWLDENELDEGVIDHILACNMPKLRRLSLTENMDLEDLDDDKKEEIRAKFLGTKVYFDEAEAKEGDQERPDETVDDLAAAMAGLQT